jgi:hypothetical protein
VDIFEADPNSGQLKIEKRFAIKKYERIKEGRPASEIRTPDVLNKVMWYMI